MLHLLCLVTPGEYKPSSGYLGPSPTTGGCSGNSCKFLWVLGILGSKTTFATMELALPATAGAAVLPFAGLLAGAAGAAGWFFEFEMTAEMIGRLAFQVMVDGYYRLGEARAPEESAAGPARCENTLDGLGMEKQLATTTTTKIDVTEMIPWKLAPWVLALEFTLHAVLLLWLLL